MDLQNIVIPSLIAFTLNMIFTPIIIKFALKFHWYDNLNDRKIHSGNIPRIGGVGIFISFIISFSFFYFVLNKKSGICFGQSDGLNWQLLSFYFAIIAIFITGLIDDFSNLKAQYKLIIQMAVSFALVSSGFLFSTIQIPFSEIIIPLKYISYPLTFVWFIGIINAVNLIDGMDGLAGGTSFLSLFILGLVGYFSGNFFMAYVSFILMASLLAFLVFNLPPAKIFMGDSGSLFLGTALALFPLSGVFNHKLSPLTLPDNLITNNMLLIATFIMIIPIFDTLSAIIRRTFIKKIHFFNPDREHLHHKLLDLKLSTRKALLIIYSFVLFSGIILIATLYFAPENNQIILPIILFSGMIVSLIGFALISLIWRKKGCH